MENKIIIKTTISFKIMLFVIILPAFLLAVFSPFLFLYNIINCINEHTAQEVIALIIGNTIIIYVTGVTLFNGILIVKHKTILKINSCGIYSYFKQANPIFVPWEIIGKIEINQYRKFLTSRFNPISYCDIRISLKDDMESQYNYTFPYALFYANIYNSINTTDDGCNCTNMKQMKFTKKFHELFSDTLEQNNIFFSLSQK